LQNQILQLEYMGRSGARRGTNPANKLGNGSDTHSHKHGLQSHRSAARMPEDALVDSDKSVAEIQKKISFRQEELDKLSQQKQMAPPPVEQDNSRKKARSRKFLTSFIIYPNHRAKAYWDLYITMILLMTCIVTPFDIAFQRSGTMMNTITDLMFGIDIIVIMNSAYYDMDMNLIDNRKDIAINYFKGWFAVDLLAIIPFDVILTNL
jgi:hypothetical protein